MKDLLEKRGHIYSDRPRFVMTGELMGTSAFSFDIFCIIMVAEPEFPDRLRDRYCAVPLWSDMEKAS